MEIADKIALQELNYRYALHKPIRLKSSVLRSAFKLMLDARMKET
jgi:hypothetical protein